VQPTLDSTWLLAEALGEEIEAAAGDDRRDLIVARDFLLLDLAHVGRPDDRQYAVAGQLLLGHLVFQWLMLPKFRSSLLGFRFFGDAYYSISMG